MSKNPEELRVAGNGSIYIAAYGAELPSAWDSTLPSAYTELGYTDEDGVTFTDEPTIERKGAWQSFYPVRILETARMAKAAANLEQWNANTLKTAAGGGSVAAAGTGSKFSPHTPGQVSEWTVVIEVIDGDITDRYVIPKCITTSTLEANLNRTDLALLPIELEAIGLDGEDPWFLLTSDATAFPADA
jgi:hypothetical protein